MTLQAYLPSHLVRRLGSAPGHDVIPCRDSFDAALLFADLTGYTALTEKLQRRGREGAEEITDVLKTAFRPVLSAVRRARGSVVSFGGDAVFVLFDGPACVRRATMAATQIGTVFARGLRIPTSAGAVRLELSQAIHFGSVHGLHLGTRERRIYLTTGPSVAALARQQASTGPGELSMSSAARREARREPPAGATVIATGRVKPARIEPYVPDHVRASARHFRGEYRRAVLLFVETRGWRSAVLQPFALRLQTVLDRYEGILVGTDLSPVGTKWYCAFGAPLMHEDDAERAARAALELRSPMTGLTVRGGLHTGVVANIWVGAPWRRSYELIGDATNTAARAASRAAWGEILATADVLAAARGLVTRSRGRHRVKGKSSPVELHAIDSVRSAPPTRDPITPLLGRDPEMRILRAALDQAARGHGSAFAIRGDAGLGKSRVKFEVSRVARAAGFDVHESRALAYGGEAFQVALAIIRAKLLIDPDAPSLAARRRIGRFAKRQRLAPHDRRRLEEVLTASAAAPASGLDAAALRLNRAVALSATLLGTSRPQLLVFEDLQWADPTSRDLIARVVGNVAASSTVVLLLHRPGYSPPDGTTELSLKELSPTDVRALLRSILGRPSRRVQELVAGRAGGNPFYVEEVARHLLETGVLAGRGGELRVVRQPRADDVPATVESVIAARLSRLSPRAKLLCQIGAVMGRSFPLRLLERYPGLDGRTGAAVAELVERELVFETGGEGRREYIFKHALTRDVAYTSILVARRRLLHRWVAGELEGTAGEDGALALRAHHWQQAGQVERARDLYLAAAHQADAALAHDDAIRFHRMHLELASRDDERSLEARLGLGRLLHRTGRFDDGQAELTAVVEAASSDGRRRLRLDALTALGELELERNRFDGASRELEAALDLAARLHDRNRQGFILMDLGRVAIATARADDAQSLLERAAALFDETHDRTGMARVLARLAIVRDMQGRATESTPLLERALAIHRETGDRAAQGELLGFLGASSTHRGYNERGASFFRRALSIARELGNRRLEGMWLNNLGLATQPLGDIDAAATFFQQAIRIFRTIGAHSFLAQSLANLATVRGDQGRFDEAHSLVSQALSMTRKSGDRRSEAMTLGQLATLLARQGRFEASLQADQRAADISRSIRLVPLELASLRRLVGLLRVVAPRGRRAARAEARCEQLIDGLEPSELQLKTLCELGLARLARGRSAAGELARCAALVEGLAIDHGNDATKPFERLDRAQRSFARGEPLLHGVHPDDVPGAVRRVPPPRPRRRQAR